MNNVRLCFGTFASILNSFRKSYKSQVKFISDLIGLVDEDSVYIENGPSITKLLKYKINFVLSKKASKPSYGKLAKNIDDNIAPDIEDDDKKLIILALLDIIRNDESLERENKERFEFYFGSYKKELIEKRSKFQFSDFVGTALLYTIDENVKNIYDNDTAPVIDKEYINDVTSPYLNDIEWDVDNQVLTLTYIDYYNKFKQLIEKHKIEVFILLQRPINGLRGSVFKNYKLFRQEFSPENFKYDESSEMGKKIALYLRRLDDYIAFLTSHMVEVSPGIFHPIFSIDGLLEKLEEGSTYHRIRINNTYGDMTIYAFPHKKEEIMNRRRA